MKEDAIVENPRAYAPDAVDELRHLLVAGGQAQRDPRRANFYEVDAHKNSYYIYISPITGHAVLLAKWSRQPESCYADADSMVA
jgi:hypothetical protein